MVFLYGFVFIKKAKLIAVLLFTDVGLRTVAAARSPTPAWTSLLSGAVWKERMMGPWGGIGCGSWEGGVRGFLSWAALVGKGGICASEIMSVI